MANTKKKKTIREKRQLLCGISLTLSFLAFLFLLFEFSLTTHGGWDDMNYGLVSCIPLIAAASMFVAIVNIVKYRTQTKEIAPAIMMVTLSSFFYCYVMIYTTTVVLANS